MINSMRREAIFVGIIWCCAAAYTVGYCGTFGYGRSIEDLKFIAGFPDWVFWGIVLPWSVCLGVGVVFATFMKDVRLVEEVPEPGDPGGMPGGPDGLGERDHG
jgi:hypothetical protein